MKTTMMRGVLLGSVLLAANLAACGADEGETDSLAGAGGSSGGSSSGGGTSGGGESSGGESSGGESSGGTSSGGMSSGGDPGSGGFEPAGGSAGAGGTPTSGVGGGEGGSLGSVDSGLPGDTPAGELSPEQIEQVCQAVNTYAEDTYDLDEAVCRAAAATLAARLYAEVPQVMAAAAVCRQNMQQCLDDPDAYLSLAGISLGGGLLDCGEAPESLEDCPATVDDYETCSQARIDGVAELALDVPSCDELTADNLAEGAESGFFDLAAVDQAGAEACDPITSEPGCDGLGF